MDRRSVWLAALLPLGRGGPVCRVGGGDAPWNEQNQTHPEGHEKKGESEVAVEQWRGPEAEGDEGGGHPRRGCPDGGGPGRPPRSIEPGDDGGHEPRQEEGYRGIDYHARPGQWIHAVANLPGDDKRQYQQHVTDGQAGSADSATVAPRWIDDSAHGRLWSSICLATTVSRRRP